jgi:hypothetical protein
VFRSFVVPLYERGVDGVLVRTIAKPTGEQGVGGLAQIDESLTSRLSAVDSAVDSLKDTVLHKAQKIKNNVRAWGWLVRGVAWSLPRTRERGACMPWA